MWWLPSPEFETDAEAFRIAAQLTVLPWLFGLVLGFIVRRWRMTGGSAAVRFSSAALPVWVALGVASWPVPLGAWDLLSLGVLTTLGVLAGEALAAHGLRRLAGGLGLSALVLLGAEGLLRLPPRATREWPEPRQAHLFGTVSWHSIGNCSLAFPPEDEMAALSAAASDPKRTVLHVGDSMLSWEFEKGIAEAFPEATHVTAAVPGAGPEGYTRAVENWLAARPASEVFVYLFVGNDIHGLFDRNACCRGLPLYELDASGLHSNCEEEKVGFSLRDQLAQSAAPFAWRVMAQKSRLAGAGVEAFARLSRLVERPPPTLGDGNYRKLDALLGEMEAKGSAHGARLHVVVLPFRKTIELSLGRPTSPDQTWRGLESGLAAHRRIVGLAAARGIDTLDAWETMRAAVEVMGNTAFTPSPEETDVHFTGDAMQRLTVWLAGKMRSRGIAEEAPR